MIGEKRDVEILLSTVIVEKIVMGAEVVIEDYASNVVYDYLVDIFAVMI